MTSESSFKAENPDKIVDLASFPVNASIGKTSRAKCRVRQTQREFVGIIVHLGQCIGNDPMIEVSLVAVIGREVVCLLRVENEFAECLEVRFKSGFWDLDFFLGFPRPFSPCFLILVVPKRTFYNRVTNVLCVEQLP